MTILEQILAGLQQKFAGVDTAILTRIATKKAEGVTDETKVNSIVEGIGFSDVLNSYGDFSGVGGAPPQPGFYQQKKNITLKTVSQSRLPQPPKRKRIKTMCLHGRKL